MKAAYKRTKKARLQAEAAERDAQWTADFQMREIELAASNMAYDLRDAGVTTRTAAEALSIDERDRILRVAAWSGTEDAAWSQVLQILP